MVKRRLSNRGGFTLVGMIIIFTVMAVLISAAMPIWSKVIQREKEEELIFRGMQYAEAIRVFQLRNGRYPLRLEELLTVKPRSIRQLWPDPMTDSGAWAPIFAQTAPGQQQKRRGRRGRQGAGQDQQQPQTFGGSGPQQLGGERGQPRRAAVGTIPIIGVHSRSEDEALKSFFGAGTHNQWLFTADLVPVASLSPNSLSPVRANARWVGRPFRPGLGPEAGNTPEQSGQGPGERNRRRRANRNGGD
jgi:type II secretory pathway pseudopilin PulG